MENYLQSHIQRCPLGENKRIECPPPPENECPRLRAGNFKFRGASSTKIYIAVKRSSSRERLRNQVILPTRSRSTAMSAETSSSQRIGIVFLPHRGGFLHLGIDSAVAQPINKVGKQNRHSTGVSAALQCKFPTIFLVSSLSCAPDSPTCYCPRSA